MRAMRGTLEGPWKILSKRSANCITKQIPACEEAGRLSGFVQSPSSSFLERVAICSLHSLARPVSTNTL
jgi:hypothetical protein